MNKHPSSFVVSTLQFISLHQHPDGGEIEVMPSMYEKPFVRHNDNNVTIPDNIKPEDITREQAIGLLDSKARGVKTVKVLGEHPTGGKIEVRPSQFGKPYVKHNKTNVTIPEHIQPNAITLDQAIELIDSKANS